MSRSHFMTFFAQNSTYGLVYGSLDKYLAYLFYAYLP